MLFTAVIIDDEENGRNALKSSLKMFCSSFEVIGEADGVQSGLVLLQRLKPDVLFLDVRMKDGDGFDLLEALKEHNFKLVFTTAYDQYAVKAFRFSALDYLLKPIDPESLIALEAKIIKLGRTEHQNYTAALANKDSLQMIGLNTYDGLSYFRIDGLIRCEAESNYTSFYFTDMKVLVSKPLKEYEELLPESTFFRIHKSHLIQNKFIAKVNKSSNTVEMSDGSVLELARRRKDEFLDWIKNAH